MTSWQRWERIRYNSAKTIIARYYAGVKFGRVQDIFDYFEEQQMLRSMNL